MKGFKNIKVYVEGKGIIVTSLAVENGKIANFCFECGTWIFGQNWHII